MSWLALADRSPVDRGRAETLVGFDRFVCLARAWRIGRLRRFQLARRPALRLQRMTFLLVADLALADLVRIVVDEVIPARVDPRMPRRLQAPLVALEGQLRLVRFRERRGLVG